jgi:hypothetical protein
VSSTVAQRPFLRRGHASPRLRGALLLAGVVAVAGCQRIVDVTGTVLLDGKPVKGVIVVFDPPSTDQPRGVASTDENGVYRLRRLGPGSKPGVPTGAYKVKVMSDMDNPGGGRIPEKYYRDSPLSRDVTGPSPHTYDIELSTKQ